MAGKPYQSILTPHLNEIITLRRKKPPVSYSQIAVLLREKYKIVIRGESIQNFLEVRVKRGYKTCKLAWDFELPEAGELPITEAKTEVKPTTLSKQSFNQDKRSKPETEMDVSQLPEITYSDTYNLTRLSDKEAAKWLKIIEERKKH